ncbi:hypothetical protein IWQ60_001835 [Tieghemiomyces parasiticus]|uniref:Carotenoid oxygenase n=1 Tax=Tieghemiomyces parasiticus TaxID=78921 RepID=A0A9W8AIL1_9FUNG|nr:hypothetical protein IWQ60_001835 [Tieghemiomyces parasiticus]
MSDTDIVVVEAPTPPVQDKKESTAPASEEVITTTPKAAAITSESPTITTSETMSVAATTTAPETHTQPEEPAPVAIKSPVVKAVKFKEPEVGKDFIEPSAARTPEPEPVKETVRSTPTEPRLQAPPGRPITHVGGFRNAREQPRPVTAPLLSGSLPADLQGTLYTLGPGTFDLKYSRRGHNGTETRPFTFGHWFDHLPLVGRLTFGGPAGSVEYCSRLTAQAMASKIETSHGYLPKLPGALYRTDTNTSFLSKLMGGSTKRQSKSPGKEVCHGSIATEFIWPGDERAVVCLNHTGQIQKIDPVTLEPREVVLWDEIDANFMGTQTAPHVHYDRDTGETIGLAVDIGYQTTEFNVFATRHNVADGPTSTLLANFVARPSLIHSFAVTPRYVVIVAPPMHGTLAGLRFAWKSSLLDTFTFNPQEPTLIYVVSRAEHRLVATYQADPFFSLHHINAFEDDRGNVYVDLVTYVNDLLLEQLTLARLRDPTVPLQLPTPEIRRYLLANVPAEAARAPPAATVVAGRAMDLPLAHFSTPAKSGVELPCVHPAFRQYAHRYVYGIGHVHPHPMLSTGFWDALSKVDMLRKEDTRQWAESGCYPGEPVFVPRPARNRNKEAASVGVADAVQEDGGDVPTEPEREEEEEEDAVDEEDGYILSTVYDSRHDRSFVLVLDARDMQEVARVGLPHVVPLAFGHGAFRAHRASTTG